MRKLQAYHSMESARLVTYWTIVRVFGFAGAELPEILCCFRNHVVEELHLDTAKRLAYSGY